MAPDGVRHCLKIKVYSGRQNVFSDYLFIYLFKTLCVYITDLYILC